MTLQPPDPRTRCLAFDLSLPVGPLELHEECRVSPTAVSFHGGLACGYTHGIFCKALEAKAADPKIHVVTFNLSELVQDYGLNAASIWMRWMRKPSRTTWIRRRCLSTRARSLLRARQAT